MPIDSMIFDLDGTLVQTEKLKARSYARAVTEFCPQAVTESEVISAFKEVVGRSGFEVAAFLVDRFALEEKASQRLPEFGVRTGWQAFVTGQTRPGDLSPGRRSDWSTTRELPGDRRFSQRRGMRCIAVTTPYTRQAIHTSKLLKGRWIVDDPGTLLEVVAKAHQL
jgi:hypothetical protein